MSEREKKILDIIIKAFPQMSEFDKGYFLGVAESKAGEKEREAISQQNDTGEEGNK